MNNNEKKKDLFLRVLFEYLFFSWRTFSPSYNTCTGDDADDDTIQQTGLVPGSDDRAIAAAVTYIAV